MHDKIFYPAYQAYPLDHLIFLQDLGYIITLSNYLSSH